MALDSGIQTNQILTNDDEVCIPRLSSILLAVLSWTNKGSKFNSLNSLSTVSSRKKNCNGGIQEMLKNK